MKIGHKVTIQHSPAGTIICATNMAPDMVIYPLRFTEKEQQTMLEERVEQYEAKRKEAYENWINNFNGIVHIADFWDRSPCMWFCDLSQLDENDPVQATYKKAVRTAMKNSTTMNKNEEKPNGWYLPGSTSLHGFGGRPDQVKHAVVYPPCNVEASVLLYYP